MSNEFTDVLSRTLREHPSNVGPMVIEIDLEKWASPANRLPPRLITAAQQEEVRKQIELMLELGVVRPSQQPYYSQAHLVPSLEGLKWRLTIDYHNFNRCTTLAGWPIPTVTKRQRYNGYELTSLDSSKRILQQAITSSYCTLIPTNTQRLAHTYG
jgi:hypothetical protein